MNKKTLLSLVLVLAVVHAILSAVVLHMVGNDSPALTTKVNMGFLWVSIIVNLVILGCVASLLK